MHKRIVELDSLRGIAALTVVVTHLKNMGLPIPEEWMTTPLRILWAGHEAVILFFILSGFVLTFPFMKNKKVNYPEFMIKRFFRIYIPFIVAILFSLVLKRLFFTESIRELGWANKFWTIDITQNEFFHHFLLITNYNTDMLDPVIWSLVHEMRISLIFPFLVVIILKINWKNSLLMAFAFSVIGAMMHTTELGISNGYLNSYARSVHYIAMFIIGSLMAIHMDTIVNSFKRLNGFVKVSILIIGICSYTLQVNLGQYIQTPYLLFIREWFIAVGSCIFIIASIGMPSVSAFLSLKISEFFGKISYSLYLYHVPILVALLYVFHGKLSLWAIFVIGLILTVVVSYLSWKYVENNAITMGRYIAKKVVTRKTKTVASQKLS
ncbi:acyltransferase [Planococcus sp. N028]|uniref:Acyltransferase n=1 Tax=Planococcus shixiaomingii TaxID=3058393 RepID=A0ABT8N1C8_9BACL|nr:acyltransferase [Planococcus sp. N028]MDN7241683.1 acyltransferase [Planococcus sp. N028]